VVEPRQPRLDALAPGLVTTVGGVTSTRHLVTGRPQAHVDRPGAAIRPTPIAPLRTAFNRSGSQQLLSSRLAQSCRRNTSNHSPTDRAPHEGIVRARPRNDGIRSQAHSRRDHDGPNAVLPRADRPNRRLRTSSRVVAVAPWWETRCGRG
jgi:hypothetical protein